MAAAAMSPVPPSPTIPKSLLEKVTGCQVLTHLIQDGSKPGDNYMSVIYSVTAEVIPPGESSSETRHYLFKCYPRHPGRQTYLNKTNMFYNELLFYSVWVKALVDFQTELVDFPKDSVITPGFPPFIGGKAINFAEIEKSEDEETKIYQPIDNFIVLTDLRRTWDYKMLEGRAGLQFQHVRLTVMELAKIHALSWAYRQKVEWDLIKKFPFLRCALNEDDKEMWTKIVSQNVEIAVNTMDAAFGPGNQLSQSTKAFQEKVGKVIELFLSQKEEAERKCWDLHRLPEAEMVKASESEKPWRVICHGDTWCNNLLFKMNQESGDPESVMLVDFQLSREGCPTSDLAYLLYTSTTVEFRRSYLHQILKIYHDKFNQVCKTLKVPTLPDFSLETLKRRFQRSKVLGFMMAVTTFPMMLRKTDDARNLEGFDENTKMDDMFMEAFAEGAEGSSLYKTRIVELARELYDEGVI